MRGGLDDTLARLARREEVLRQRAAQLAATEKKVAAEASPLNEVTEAVRRVVSRHPELAVTLWVANGQEKSSLRVAWSEGQVTAVPVTEPPESATGAAAPSWPMSVKTVPAWAAATDGLADDPAARLANLIRHNPSLLADGPADET